jgi:hypothetical protein
MSGYGTEFVGGKRNKHVVTSKIEQIANPEIS